jgi:hypothetical protein
MVKGSNGAACRCCRMSPIMVPTYSGPPPSTIANFGPPACPRLPAWTRRTSRISDPAPAASGMQPRRYRGVHCIRFVRSCRAHDSMWPPVEQRRRSRINLGRVHRPPKDADPHRYDRREGERSKQNCQQLRCWTTHPSTHGQVATKYYQQEGQKQKQGGPGVCNHPKAQRCIRLIAVRRYRQRDVRHGK